MKKSLSIIIASQLIVVLIGFLLHHITSKESNEFTASCYGTLTLPNGNEVLLYYSPLSHYGDHVFCVPYVCKIGDQATVFMASGEQHTIVCTNFIFATIEDNWLCYNGEYINHDADYLFYMIGDEMKYAYVWLWDIYCPGC